MKLHNAFIPTPAQGHIIVTTRIPSSGKIKKLFVNEMEEDGVLFLLRRTGIIEEDEEIGNVRPGDLESEKKINEIFGGLALGLGQAGSCVELNGISMVCYLKLYDSSGNKLLGEKDEARDYP